MGDASAEALVPLRSPYTCFCIYALKLWRYSITSFAFLFFPLPRIRNLILTLSELFGRTLWTGPSKVGLFCAAWCRSAIVDEAFFDTTNT